jgi:hypothetical protein
MRPVIVGASVIALCSSVALADEPVAQQPLQLTCLGAGTANKATVATVNSNAYGSGMVGTTPYSGSAYGSSTVTIPRREGFSDQVDVRLFNGDDRIRMPRTMLPLFHGGNDGWFRLKNVVVDGRTIRAKVAVNFMNSPNVFIDRVTGTISISGKAGHYSGACQAVDADAPAKF